MTEGQDTKKISQLRFFFFIGLFSVTFEPLTPRTVKKDEKTSFQITKQNGRTSLMNFAPAETTERLF